MTSESLILVLCSINLVTSFVSLYMLIRDKKSDEIEEEEDVKEDLLVERNLNSRLRYLQTTRFGPSMVPHSRGETFHRKNDNDNEKR